MKPVEIFPDTTDRILYAGVDRYPDMFKVIGWELDGPLTVVMAQHVGSHHFKSRYLSLTINITEVFQ